MSDDSDRLPYYRRGWIDGAGFREYDDDGLSGSFRAAYQTGYQDGRKAFVDAMDEARCRLGLPDATSVKPCDKRDTHKIGLGIG